MDIFLIFNTVLDLKIQSRKRESLKEAVFKNLSIIDY